MGYKSYRTKQEWLDDRRIGGSSASAIVGLNPWKSKQDLYEELTGNKADGTKDSPVLKYGHDAEPILRKLFKINHPELLVIPPKKFDMYSRPDKPYLTATIDGGLVDKKTGRKGILEIKTHDVRKSSDMDNWRENQLPKNYITQGLHYLIVLQDREWVDYVAKLRFFSYDGETSKLEREEVRYYHIERSEVEKELAWLEEQETKFYENYVKKGIRPPMPTTIKTIF